MSGTTSFAKGPAIVFGGLGDGYNEYPGRQKLLHVIGEKHPVLFLKWSYSRIPRWTKPKLKHIRDNLYEIDNAYSLRYSALRRMGSAVGLLDGLFLREILNRNGFSRWMHWISAADKRLAWGLLSDRMIYDCVDPCFIESHQCSFDRDEEFVAKKARLVFCTALTLKERLSKWNANVHLLPNACSRATLQPSPLNELFQRKLSGLRRPFVGYLGTIDWRFDAKLVATAATLLPDFTFLLAGRLNEDQRDRTKSLSQLPNVEFLGSIPFEQGDAFVHALDIAIIPFTPSSMNDAINPVKMYMNLAAGKPVVSSWIRECREVGEFVKCAQSGEKFAQLIRSAYLENSSEMRDKRREYAAHNSWDVRAVDAISILSAANVFN